MPEPITCHVLDTYSGRPGSSIPVTLRLISTSSPTPGSTATPPPSPVVFTAQTNADGRIAGWAPHASSSTAGPPSLFAAFAQVPAGTKMTWEIVFELEAFWAAKPVDAFFPRATIAFLTSGFGQAADEGQPHPEHWHVPLLVSPFSYTTYRGS